MRRGLNAFGRETHGHGGAVADLALDLHRPAVQLDEGIGRRQLQPRALAPAIERTSATLIPR